MERSIPQGRPATARRRIPIPALAALAALAAGAVALGLGIRTLLPGVGFWDTAEFQVVGPVLGTAHPTGFPAYVVLGWLASIVFQPLGEPAVRMNLLSAVLAAVTAGGTTLLVVGLTARPLIGLAGGLALAATPVAWSLSNRADAHALHGSLVAILLVLLVAWGDRRRADRPSADRLLVAAAAVTGVAIANHSLTLLLAPGIGLFVLATEPGILRRRGLVGRCAAVLVAVVVALYLELPIRAATGAPLVYGRPDTVDGLRYIVAAEQFRGSLEPPFANPVGRAGEIVRATVDQLGPLTPLLPAAVIAVILRRPRFALLTIPGWLLTSWFAAVYINAEIERYHLGPTIIAVAWLAVLGDGLVDLVGGSERLGRRARAGAVAALGVAVALGGPNLAAIPARLPGLDRSDDVAAARWLDRMFAVLEPDAVVVSWWSYSTPLWYGTIVEGRRPDVEVVDDRTRLDLGLGTVEDVIDANLGRRPVYVVRPLGELAPLRTRYVLERVAQSSFGQPTHRVLERRPARP